MRRYGIVALLGILLVASGCRAVEDAKAGMAAHQQEIQNQTSTIVGGTVDLAFPLAHAPATLAVSWILAWWFGRRDRLATKGKSEHPALGWIGGKLPILEDALQHVADVFHGAYDLGPDGSPLKRGWKFWLTGVLTALGAAAALPQVQTFVAQHAGVLLVLNTVGAGIATIEKALSSLKPVQDAAPGPAAQPVS